MQSIIRGGIFTSTMLSCLLAACGPGGGSSSTSPSTTSRTVSIIMNQAWTDSGLAVMKGQRQAVSASGKLNWLTGNKCFLAGQTCTTTPDGNTWSTCATQPPPAFTAPGLACWSLIGKIGANGTPFEVGASSQFTDRVTGELFLGINDNVYTDDTGSWSATVTQI